MEELLAIEESTDAAPQDAPQDETSYAVQPSSATLSSIEAQRSMRMRAAVASHITLALLLVSGGLAIAGKGPKWLRSKWFIIPLIPTYFYTLHLAMRETYWMGASDTQGVDGGPPII